MHQSPNRALLTPEDIAAVQRVNPDGASPVLLIGDHAGVAVPAALGDLGIAASEFRRHIAIDIGIRALGEALSVRLDAAFLWQAYSRLVIDCNRDPAASGAMPAISDGTPIPANADLSPADRADRIAAIHAPYQDAIAAAIADRSALGQATILVSLHSFTPVMAGVARPWHVGILHNGANDRFSRAMLAGLRAHGGLVVGDNEPYRMDVIDHTVPRHAFSALLPYAEIEVRQDEIGSAAGVARWAAILEDVIRSALEDPATDARTDDAI